MAAFAPCSGGSVSVASPFPSRSMPGGACTGRVRIRRIGRKKDVDARAAPLFRIDDEIASVELRQSVGYRQTEARSVMTLVEAAVDLAERTHRNVDLVGRHAGAGVGNEDLDEAVGGRSCSAVDAPALGREFHCIAEKIDENLLEAQRVGQQERRIREDFAGDGRSEEHTSELQS